MRIEAYRIWPSATCRASPGSWSWTISVEVAPLLAQL
jgi:hypothetical protein